MPRDITPTKETSLRCACACTRTGGGTSRDKTRVCGKKDGPRTVLMREEKEGPTGASKFTSDYLYSTALENVVSILSLITHKAIEKGNLTVSCDSQPCHVSPSLRSMETKVANTARASLEICRHSLDWVGGEMLQAICLFICQYMTEEMRNEFTSFYEKTFTENSLANIWNTYERKDAHIGLVRVDAWWKL